MKGSECCAAPCRFWLKLDADGTGSKDYGQCRRRSPRFDGAMYLFGRRESGEGSSAMLFGTSYPMTVADDWCGEFEPDGFQGPF